MNPSEKRSWTDWVSYFGSKDERHRQVADEAGHRAFLPAFFIAAVDFLCRFPGVVTAVLIALLYRFLNRRAAAEADRKTGTD
jgi:hypothetical protein